MKMEKILLTGAFGQIGTELFPKLQKKYGEDSVIALAHEHVPENFLGITEKGDVRNKEVLKEIIIKHKITQIYHLASLLSAVGETKPQLAWAVNMDGLKNVLDLALEFKLKIFWPSSIAVFGPTFGNLSLKSVPTKIPNQINFSLLIFNMSDFVILIFASIINYSNLFPFV
jgi:nucleoside-diphosphate-sugar epimerase